MGRTTRESNTEAYGRLFENAIAIIISLASNWLLGDITAQTNQVEITLIVFLAVVIWLYIDQHLRRFIDVYTVTRENAWWHAWLTRLLNLWLLLGIFLVARLVMFTTQTAVQNGDLNSAEKIAFMLVALGCAFALMISFQQLSASVGDAATARA